MRSWRQGLVLAKGCFLATLDLPAFSSSLGLSFPLLLCPFSPAFSGNYKILYIYTYSTTKQFALPSIFFKGSHLCWLSWLTVGRHLVFGTSTLQFPILQQGGETQSHGTLLGKQNWQMSIPWIFKNVDTWLLDLIVLTTLLKMKRLHPKVPVTRPAISPLKASGSLSTLTSQEG